MQAIDMQLLCGEADSDDAELLELFRHRREKIDDTVMVKGNDGKVWLIRKEELLRIQKRKEDLKRAVLTAAGITVAIAAGSCMVNGIGNPWAALVFAAVWGGWILKHIPREVAG